MSDEDRSPLTNNEQREVDRHLKRHPSAVRADLEDAMRRRRQHDARIAKRDRDAAELLAKNAATIARPDLTPEERREAEIAAEEGKSAESAVNMARQIAHMTNGTAAGPTRWPDASACCPRSRTKPAHDGAGERRREARGEDARRPNHGGTVT